jgi:probable rRNA maturation factor
VRNPSAQSAIARQRLRLSISAAAGRSIVPFLRRMLPVAHQQIKTSLRELSVALVGDATMSELHERFLSIAGPTDVLTFPLDEGERGQCVSGEVVVCVPEARRQAKARAIPVEHEVLLYAVHGMLHLSGFDDRTQADYRKMHRTEDRILTELGIGATFHTNDDPKGRRRRQHAARKTSGGRR